ncbi:MAG TPA: acyltransferase [Pirellulaceae bacterium]|nr:acyltransferase [Pirellulaceae bacterium]
MNACATIAATSLEMWDSFDSSPSGSIRIGDRCTIGIGAIVATYGGVIDIASDVTVNPYTIIYGHGGVTIGPGTRIAAHTAIVPANHNFDRPDIPVFLQGLSKLGIEIGEDVWIASGVRILDGVKLGDHSVIAAGAVVTRDVAPWSIVGGVPAKPLKDRPRSWFGDPSVRAE